MFQHKIHCKQSFARAPTHLLCCKSNWIEICSHRVHQRQIELDHLDFLKFFVNLCVLFTSSSIGANYGAKFVLDRLALKFKNLCVVDI